MGVSYLTGKFGKNKLGMLGSESAFFLEGVFIGSTHFTVCPAALLGASTGRRFGGGAYPEPRLPFIEGEGGNLLIVQLRISKPIWLTDLKPDPPIWFLPVIKVIFWPPSPNSFVLFLKLFRIQVRKRSTFTGTQS